MRSGFQKKLIVVGTVWIALCTSWAATAIGDDRLGSRIKTDFGFCQETDTPHQLLANNSPEAALQIMQKDPQWINRRDESSRTPLHVAARYGHVKVVKWLLDSGAHVDALAYNGFTPLHLTSAPEVVSLILEYKPSLEISCRSSGETVMQKAVSRLESVGSEPKRKKWQAIVDMYVSAGATYDIITAIIRDDLVRVKEIMRSPPDINDGFYDNSPLRRAASLGRLEICRYLIEEKKMDVDQFEQGSGYPIIKDAVAHPEVVRLLIESGADLERRITWQSNRTGFWIIGDDATALHFAARDGVPESIKLLIDAGVEVLATAKDPMRDESPVQTALDIAAFFGKADNLEQLVTDPSFRKVDVKSRKEILNRCLVTGSLTIRRPKSLKLFEVLLGNGAEANAKLRGKTAIQAIGRSFHPNDDSEELAQKRRLVKLLMTHGGEIDLATAVATGDEVLVERTIKSNPESINARRDDGYPALHCAVAMNYPKVVAQMLKADANVNIPNRSDRTGHKGGTPLHCAAFWGRDQLAKELIKAGANADARAESGWTPLHSAVAMSNLKMIGVLLDSGASTDIKNDDGEVPLDLCSDRSLGTVRKMFQSYARQ